MKSISYVIKDAQGIHARPAGELVKLCGSFNSKITISKAGQVADAKRIFGIMGLAAKKGDEIIMRADGDDEDKAISRIETFLKENL